MIIINNTKIDAFVDFGNGFKFIVEDANLDDFGNLQLKVHPKSLKWVELEHNLHNPLSLRGYEQFLAECYEAEDKFWEEYYKYSQADEIIMSQKENF